MPNYLIAAAFLMHGFAHGTGFLASWTGTTAVIADRPRIFSSSGTLRSAVGHVFGLLWLVSMFGLVVAGLGLPARQGWWPTLAVIAASLSLVVIVP